MLFTTLLAALLPAVAVHATYDHHDGPQDHKVTVGADGKLLFNPEYVNAAIGDTVTFVFNPKAHSVTQSLFDSPCSPLEYGFDTGLVPVAPGATWEMTFAVNNTSPEWFYCKQQNPKPHCGQGMVFAINPPPEGDPHSFKAFKDLALKTGQAPVDHKIVVGVDGDLKFGPANITAAIGDTVTFEFQPKAHGVTQSSFDQPCTPLSDADGKQIGFSSGITPVPDDGSVGFPRKFTITVLDAKPIWGFCPQTMPAPHCGKGMVFSINADENGPNNFEAFLEKAKETANPPHY